MKNKSDCFRLLENMIDCICQFSDTSQHNLFRKSYNQLRITLQKEYFTPFDREDIYMIAVRLNSLYRIADCNKSTVYISPLLNKINEIINLFDKPGKNKFRNIFDAVSEYYKINTDDILLSVSDKDKNNIINLINSCNETVIQIEYTILKNS